MRIGSYNSKITDKALILSDLFGTESIPWNSIVSMSTVSTDGDVIFTVVAMDKTFYVNRASGYTVETFGDYVAKKSNLEVDVDAKPTLMRRWKKSGTEYKYANYLDKLTDSFYGIKSKEGTLLNYAAWIGFTIVVVIFALIILGASLEK